MTRGCFVPAGGDPFVLLLFMRLFRDIWVDEIDRLHVCFNRQSNKEVVNFVRKRLLHPKVNFIYIESNLDYGKPFNYCLKDSKEDLVVLMEEDGFVFKRGLLDELFRKIEEGFYDVIGSPRFSCTDGILEASKNKYELDYSGFGDVGPNFWPNFFFCKRNDLLNTNLDFGPKGWKKGEFIPQLDMICQQEECGDTFVWMSMQLRANGLRFLNVPQRKADPLEINAYEDKSGDWGNPFGWIHGGSLSSGIEHYFDGKTDILPNDYCRQEMETRVAFWTISVNLEPYDEIGEFRDYYKNGIEKAILNHQMNRERINRKIEIYKELLGL